MAPPEERSAAPLRLPADEQLQSMVAVQSGPRMAGGDMLKKLWCWLPILPEGPPPEAAIDSLTGKEKSMTQTQKCGWVMLFFFAYQDLKKVQKFKCGLSRNQRGEFEKSPFPAVLLISEIIGKFEKSRRKK